MKKDKAPKEQIKVLASALDQTLRNWNNQYKNGCNDPTWPDGVNLNLLRNHVSYYKGEILKICKENNITLPPEYFSPLPPYVDNNYFTNPMSERAVRIISNFGLCANQEEVNKNPLDSIQGTLF